jgi:hypothetical protein
MSSTEQLGVAIRKAGLDADERIYGAEPTPAQKAYGALWREVHDTPLVREARLQLRDSLTQEERRTGIAWALEAFGPVSTSEMIAADMRAGIFPQRSI